MELLHQPGVDRADDGQGATDGALTAWIAAKSLRDRRSLLQDLIRIDTTLRERLSGVYTAPDTRSRLALLLMFECARSGPLSAGELAMLMDEPAEQLESGLKILLAAGYKAPQDTGDAAPEVRR